MRYVTVRKTHLRGLYADVEHVFQDGEGQVELVGLKARVHEGRARHAVRDGSPRPHLAEKSETPLELLRRRDAVRTVCAAWCIRSCTMCAAHA